MNLPGKTIPSVIKMFKERTYVRLIAGTHHIIRDQLWEIIRAYCDSPDEPYAKAQGKPWPPERVSAFQRKPKALERVKRYDAGYYGDIPGAQVPKVRMAAVDYR